MNQGQVRIQLVLQQILQMSQFLSDTSIQNKKMTQNRVLMLSQKINNLKFGHKAESERKLDQIEKSCEDIQHQLENIKSIFDNNCFDVKILMNKIQNQLAFDYVATDKNVKQSIQKCEQRFIEMTEMHVNQRKASDSRLSKFIDQKCAVLRDLVQRQVKQRVKTGQTIQNSLNQDMNEIKIKLEEEKSINQQNLQQIHTDFLTRYEEMRRQFNEVCEKSSNSQGQFYKMLRDILKKVKEEISCDRLKRQEMQETILALIEKICDKAMEEVDY